EQVRPLGEGRAHEQAAITSPENGKMSRRRVLMADQVFSAGDEVVENILLASEVPSSVPFFAVFAAAADISGNVNPALIEPNSSIGADKVWLLVNAVTTIPIQQRGVAPIDLHAFAANDVNRDPGSIYRDSEVADNLGVIELNGRSFVERCARGLGRDGIEAVPGGGIEIGGSIKKHVALADGYDLADGGNWRKRWGCELAPLFVEDAYSRWASHDVDDVQPAGSRHEVVDGGGSCLFGTCA